MMKFSYAALITLFFILTTPIISQAQVWVDTNSWSEQEEKNYSDWVKREWKKDFFARATLPNGQANPYKGLRSDCADTVYSMRLIYAYEHRLPFVIQDPSKFGNTISNKLNRYNNKSREIDRVRAFLEDMFDTISTRSLPNDTYPVAITPSAIRSGALMLTTTKNHHSWTIKEILNIGVPWLVYNSTIGAASGSMFKERQSWPNPAWVFEDNHSPTGFAGIRDWRPTEFLNKPVWQTPGYSEEQYQIPLNKWVKTVQSRIAVKQEQDEQKINRLYTTACEGLQMRIEAVKEGVDYVTANPQCMSYATYDIYSTPNRDRRLFDDLMALRSAAQEIFADNQGQTLQTESIQKLKMLFPQISKDVATETENQKPNLDTAICKVQYAPGQFIDLVETKRRITLGYFSNNPHDGMDQRWGNSPTASKLAKKCQSWDIWTPDLNGH